MIRLSLSLIFCFILSSLSFAQLKSFKKDTLNRTDSAGLKQGHWIKKNPKGGVEYEGQFENGAPYGKFTYYYSNGTIRSITYFKKNTRQAYTQLFSDEGKKISEGKVVGEAKDSTWNFYENDMLIMVENYSLGKKHGAVKKYYLNGKLMDERIYKNDVLDGPVKVYYPNEQFKMQATLVNGLYQGDAMFYFPNGKIQCKGIYSNDFKEGKWTYYLVDGSIESETIYKRSKVVNKRIFNGEITDFYGSGMPKVKTVYKDGTKNGVYLEYYDVGEKKVVEVPATEDGYPAEKKEVIVGQKIQKKGTYKNGKLDGKLTFYRLDGTVEKEEIYKDGVLIP